MKFQAHEIEMLAVGLAVDQDQIGPDVTVPVVFPLAGQRMISIMRLKRLIRRQICHDMCKFRIDGVGEPASLLAIVIPSEGRSPSNRPN